MKEKNNESIKPKFIRNFFYLVNNDNGKTELLLESSDELDAHKKALEKLGYFISLDGTGYKI